MKIIFLLSFLPVMVFADVKKIAATCAACHGVKGISENPLFPNLAGQKREYLKKQLLDFKNDLRKDPVMTAQAKMLSEKDVEEISKYFADMKAP